MSVKKGTLSMLVPALLVATAQAQTPPGLSDLVGARGAGGETALQSRGYVFVRGQKGDDRSYTFWWNAAQHQCITVATMDGRYASITATPPADCGQRAERPRAAPNDRDRGAYRPDIGYGQTPSSQRQSPSYVEDRDRYRVGNSPVDLGLVCFGDGQRPGMASTYGWTWNSRTHRYDYGNRVELTGQQFDASLMIQLWAGGGRIRLPKKLVPPINSRGDDGWWDLYDVEMGPDVIRATYRLNGLNKPRVTINRRSGQISVQGLEPYAFRGTCDLVDGADHRRF
ncbi:hypothetical protein [Novosphingobium soli]|uniref:Uncharacterized protein n=1 Tax=Novosphingobium soli TaxID=574956 RepID=A0ABV6CZG8_9SPHN